MLKTLREVREALDWYDDVHCNEAKTKLTALIEAMESPEMQQNAFELWFYRPQEHLKYPPQSTIYEIGLSSWLASIAAIGEMKCL